MTSFAARHGLDAPARRDAVARIAETVAGENLETIRFAFPDQHGVLRGKTLLAADAIKALDGGVLATSTLILKDTSHRTVFPVFTPGGGLGSADVQGAADMVLLADPATFRVLPWAARTGWVLCDLYWPTGVPVPFATRAIFRRALDALAARGFEFVAGLEVEFHVYRMLDRRMTPADATQPGTPPDVALLSKGYQYLTEQRADALEPVLDLIRRTVVALGLPLRSVEVEFGPSQCEFTFNPTVGLEPADLMVLFRAAVKQVCDRHGYHATFMCRPKLANAFASGWHLHQSLRHRETGRNAFAAEREDAAMSPLAFSYLAGLLHHARAATVFTTPTINGYKRYRTNSLAPDRAIWARDNRGVMVRALGGGTDPATRLENRVGEPLANPYLYMAAQIVSGLDGIDRALDPGPPAEAPYAAEADLLPKSLDEALRALRSGTFFQAQFGDAFIDYYAHIKSAEFERFQAEVSDWEQREYFDLF